MSSIEEQLDQSFSKHRELLWEVNKAIHDHPELAYKEIFAHDTLCRALEDLGYKVTRHAYGLETALEAEAGSGGASIAYNAEYDALPEIGHACGHNLIATSSFAAFLATAEALAATKTPGRVRLLGTPAEEGDGGKIDLLEAGAYKGTDACLMGHPGPNMGPLDGVILGRTLALGSVVITFRGVNAHAGHAPWLGKNALDAAVAAYANLAMLRQQVTPTQRINVIISKGGDAPNIIPDHTEMVVLIRAENDGDLQDTSQRITRCCEGAAIATGCTVEFDWKRTYKELSCSETIAKVFEQFAIEQQQNYDLRLDVLAGASTDQGNVSYELPSLHPGFAIPVDVPNVGPHHPDFEKAAGAEKAFEAAMRFGRVMASTGVQILRDEKLREKMWAEYRETFGKEA
ncbi:hypothetical protein GQ53DRAFT_640464 [Thozetella sp. PMI_491]|nr:hypothetical protein GQ53DRAFT_640464 [Thozetella sp. PMI_491]